MENSRILSSVVDVKQEDIGCETVIENLIFENTFVLISGAPGAGKTTAGFDIAASIASNRSSWAGLNISQHLPVIYCLREGRSRLPVIVSAWEEHNNTIIPEDNFAVYDGDLMLDVSETVNDFIALLKDWVVENCLIVLDDLPHFITSEINNETGVKNAVCSIRKIINDLNATVIVMHHPSKEGSSKTAYSATRGCGNLADDADTVISVSKISAVVEKKNVLKSEFAVIKQRYSQAEETFSLIQTAHTLKERFTRTGASISGMILVPDENVKVSSKNYPRPLCYIIEAWFLNGFQTDLEGQPVIELAAVLEHISQKYTSSSSSLANYTRAGGLFSKCETAGFIFISNDLITITIDPVELLEVVGQARCS